MAALKAASDVDFSLAGEERYSSHFPQVEPHRIAGLIHGLGRGHINVITFTQFRAQSAFALRREHSFRRNLHSFVLDGCHELIEVAFSFVMAAKPAVLKFRQKWRIWSSVERFTLRVVNTVARQVVPFPEG